MSEPDQDFLSACKEKHRTACDQIISEAVLIIEYAQWLKQHPDAVKQQKRIGRCCYSITQKLVLLKQIEKYVRG